MGGSGKGSVSWAIVAATDDAAAMMTAAGEETQARMRGLPEEHPRITVGAAEALTCPHVTCLHVTCPHE